MHPHLLYLDWACSNGSDDCGGYSDGGSDNDSYSDDIIFTRTCCANIRYQDLCLYIVVFTTALVSIALHVRINADKDAADVGKLFKKLRKLSFFFRTGF